MKLVRKKSRSFRQQILLIIGDIQIKGSKMTQSNKENRWNLKAIWEEESTEPTGHSKQRGRESDANHLRTLTHWPVLPLWSYSRTAKRELRLRRDTKECATAAKSYMKTKDTTQAEENPLKSLRFGSWWHTLDHTYWFSTPSTCPFWAKPKVCTVHVLSFLPAALWITVPKDLQTGQGEAMFSTEAVAQRVDTYSCPCPAPVPIQQTSRGWSTPQTVEVTTGHCPWLQHCLILWPQVEVSLSFTSQFFQLSRKFLFPTLSTLTPNQNTYRVICLVIRPVNWRAISEQV